MGVVYQALPHGYTADGMKQRYVNGTGKDSAAFLDRCKASFGTAPEALLHIEATENAVRTGLPERLLT